MIKGNENLAVDSSSGAAAVPRAMKPAADPNVGKYSASEVQALIESQRQYFKSHATRSIDFRMKQLDRLAQAIRRYESEIFDALRSDLGKCRFEAYSTEVGFVLEELGTIKKNLPKWAKPQKVGTPMTIQPGSSEIQLQPYGVSLIIAPWNYPFQLLMSPLIGALAAGNTAVLKPSEFTPGTSAIVVKIIEEIFPREYVAVVCGAVEETQALLREQFDFVFFTGSTEVGRIVGKAAAEHMTPVVLELGGKSPCIVEPDTDLEVTARRIVWGRFMNAGQTCVAPDYLLIHQDIKDRLVPLLKEKITQFWGANPQLSRDYSRIINQHHFDRVSELMKDGEIIFGGATDRDDLYIAPTLIEGASWDSSIMQEEIFGPVLPIQTYASIDQAIEIINSRPHPLALYLFTQSSQIQEKVLNLTTSGGACINDCVVHLANGNLPFGGVGASGVGAYHGRHSMECFSHSKAILKKSFNMDLALRYPPYTEKDLKQIRFLIH